MADDKNKRNVFVNGKKDTDKGPDTETLVKDLFLGGVVVATATHMFIKFMRKLGEKEDR